MSRPAAALCLLAGLVAQLAAHLVTAGGAGAAVSTLEIRYRGPVADGRSFGDAGPYEIIAGRLNFAVDPRAPANGAITDLERATRDEGGRVRFAGDFILLKPADVRRGNGRLIYGVNNRGNLILLSMFNDAPWRNAPLAAGAFGNGFLLRRGYAMLWSGWNWDVLPGRGRLQFAAPLAVGPAGPITGPVAAEITTSRHAKAMAVAWGGSRGYPPAVADDPQARLTVRPGPDAPRRPIPRNRWRFLPGDAPVRIALDDGFQPGRLYELVYTASRPRVVGLGLAAIRDTLSFFRYHRQDAAGTVNPLAAPGDGLPTAALIYGFSQSGRAIQHLMWLGLHVDEAGRPAFDGAFVHGPGGGKGSFNHRFAQTTRHQSQFEDLLYPADVFPFTLTPQTDPVTGQRAGLREAAQRLGAVPKLVYLSAETEYWTRAASLLHTDVEGRRDVPPDGAARIYAVTGAQHGATADGARGGFLLCGNPLDYRPLARALLVALDDWVSAGRPPPPGAVPRLADGALGPLAAYQQAFPAGVAKRLPDGYLRPLRLDHGPRFASEGIADVQPPRAGAAFAALLPLPDADGNGRAGVRLPAVAVPLGTYVGWNLQRDALPATRLGRWRGGFVPFAAGRAARLAAGDPRPSLAERYGDLDGFLARTRAAAQSLVERRLLLAEDVAPITAQARADFQALTSPRRTRDCPLPAAVR